MATRKDWEKVKIGEREFSFEMLPAEIAMPLSFKVIEAFGGVIGALVPIAGVDSEELDIFNVNWNALKVREVQQSLLMMATQVDGSRITPIFEAMIHSVFNVKEKRRCNMDDFNGRILDLYKVVFFALRFNFSDFFGVSAEG